MGKPIRDNPERREECGGLSTAVREVRLQKIYRAGTRVKLRREDGVGIERVVKPDMKRPGIYCQF